MRLAGLLTSSALFLFAGAASADAASLRLRGGTPSPEPPSVTTCPNGIANAELDGCLDASLDAAFSMADMDTLIKDESGNTATLAVRPGHAAGVAFNVAGRDFKIGPRTGGVYKDPALYSFRTTGSNVNGTTFNVGTVTSGAVRVGLILWSPPSTSGLLTTQSVVMSCLGAGGSGDTCQIFPAQSNKSGPYNGSHAPGCYWSNGGASVSGWTCDFRYPNHAQTATFDGFQFGAVGGHTSSTLYVNNLDNGRPTVVIRNSRIVVDAQTNGQTIISSTPNLNMNWVFEDNDCDGGNSAVAVGAAPGDFTYRIQSGCAGLATNGTAANPTTVSFKRNYVHDWAGNPIQIALGNTSVITQANVFDRIGMNNGNVDTCPQCTGLHGATINFNTTVVGATATLKRYNDVAIYRYGSRPGVTTAPFAVLGGVGSAVTIDYDQQLTTAIVNVAQPNQAISSQWINVLRTGALSTFKVKNNYVLTSGVVHNGCFAASGDVNPGNITANAVASTGNGYTVWTVSGIATAQKEKPVPGQAVYPDQGSDARAWYATFTDLLNGTSRMDITTTVVTPTNDMQPTWQVVGLGLSDLQSTPTKIVSQIDSDSYIVSDGTGQGRTLSERYFSIGFVIQPYGSHGTTATGGTTPSNYNGTYALNGEFNTASTTNWSSGGVGIKIGNYATLDSDVDNNFDVISGAELTVGGMGLDRGNCPGTNAG